MRSASTQPRSARNFRAVDAVVDVDDAPVAVESLAVGAAKAGAAAVIHVEHRDAAARPVLDAEVERRGGGRGRATMALDEQRRLFACGRG